MRVFRDNYATEVEYASEALSLVGARGQRASDKR